MASTSTQQVFTVSSSLHHKYYYDVFVSFRGETRKTFTSHLFAALGRHGFSMATENKLKRGEKVWSQLLKAIHKSRLSVIVLSRDYAGSRWCLDELVEILECKRSFQQMVVPVFYHVDPSGVRNQSGSFKEALDKLEKKTKEGYRMEGKMERWREALTEVADLSGWNLTDVADGYESTVIESIVQDVVNKLGHKYLKVAEFPVGLESRVQDVNLLLSLGSDSIRMVGIWGTGGIGKTTIARALYNKICGEFEGSCFLSNVREISKQPNGLVHLQERLLSDIINDERQIIRDVGLGTEVIKQRAWSKKVLVILDDVDDSYQLVILGIRRDWLHSGSRIIITTRDISVLDSLGVDDVYMPKLLSSHESLQLFSWHAFRKDNRIEGFKELSREVVACTGGLPLALEVLGSSLFQRSIPEWKSTLEKLKVVPDNEIQAKLRISYDSLEDEKQNVFLDIACFFVGMGKTYTINILDGCNFFTDIAIATLCRRCLVGVGHSNELTMHDLIQDMGRDIARRENFKEPGKCSRLWFRDDAIDVLRSHKGTEAVEGILVDLPSSDPLQVEAQTFTKMNRLRLLKLRYVHPKGSYELYLSKELRWIYWFGYPFESIPSKLSMEKVVAIDLSYSNLKRAWKGRKDLSQLKHLNLSHSHHLAETPDFSGCTNLEELKLNDCTRLVKVHQSIECLDKLVVLELENCTNLRKIPLGMKSVQILNLSGSSKLVNYLGFTGSPSNLGLRSAFIQGLTSITELYLMYCNLSSIPDTLGELTSLKTLSLDGNNFCTLPACINNLSRLLVLSVTDCRKLQSLPKIPINLLCMRARNCVSLERLSLGSDFRDSPSLMFSGCHKLFEKNFAQQVPYLSFSEYLMEHGLPTNREFTVSFNASEVPDCVDYQSVGSVLSFVVPDEKIQGWTLYVVTGQLCLPEILSQAIIIYHPVMYTVEKKTKSTNYLKYQIWTTCPDDLQNQMMIHYAPEQNRILQMEAGDEVEFSVHANLHCLVKKCGINLIYEDNEKEYFVSNDPLVIIQNASPSYPDVILDKDVSTDQAMANDDEIMVAGDIEGNDPSQQSTVFSMKRRKLSHAEKGKAKAI